MISNKRDWSNPPSEHFQILFVQLYSSHHSVGLVQSYLRKPFRTVRNLGLIRTSQKLLKNKFTEFKGYNDTLNCILNYPSLIVPAFNVITSLLKMI